MRVLVVKTSSMGDVIHTLPALTDAMRALHGIRFDWAVEEGFAEIPAWHPAVGRVLPVALRRWRKSPWKAWYGGEWAAYKAALRATQYDAVIDAQGLLKSALAVTGPAQGQKFGLDRHSAKEPLAARFYDRPMAVAKGQHAVERVRQLFAGALGYALPQGRGDFGLAGRFGVKPAAPYLVFLHATTRPDKHWPDGHWRELVARAAASGAEIRLPWSNAAEKARADSLAEVSSLVRVLPKLSLTEIAAELAGASAVVSVDTGLSHLAAALDRPNITLFGPTDPGLVGGYGADQTCLRAGDFGGTGVTDMAALKPDLVWRHLAPLLNRPAKPIS